MKKIINFIKENKKDLFKLALYTICTMILSYGVIRLAGMYSLNIFTSSLINITLPITIITNVISKIISNKKEFNRFFKNKSEFLKYINTKEFESNFSKILTSIFVPLFSMLLLTAIVETGYVTGIVGSVITSGLIYLVPVSSILLGLNTNIKQVKNVFKANKSINDIKDCDYIKNLKIRNNNCVKAFKNYLNGFDKDDKRFAKIMSLVTLTGYLASPVVYTDMSCIKNGCDSTINTVKTISESYVNKTDELGNRGFDYLINKYNDVYDYVDSHVLVKKK